VLDYQNNRIGLAYQRTKFAEAIIDAVSLIRFVVWAFILGKSYIYFRYLFYLLLITPPEMLYTHSK
jgi:hypothetical protein